MNTKGLLFETPNRSAPEATSKTGGNPRLKYANRDQFEWRVMCLDHLVEETHPVRQVWDYVQGLNLSLVLDTIKAVEGNAGRPAIDPQILVVLWLYATIRGIGNAYDLYEHTKNHAAFQWICGGINIDRKTISDFRTDHGALFDDLLAQGVSVLVKSGAVLIEEIAQDGLKVRASAGKGSFRRTASIDQLVKAAEQRVEQLKKETNRETQTRQRAAQARGAEQIKENMHKAQKELNNYKLKVNELKHKHRKKKLTDNEQNELRVSTTDAEARNMKMADGGFRPAYNIQIAVDTKNTIITGVKATNAGSDGGQLQPMFEQIIKELGKIPKRWLADGGFKNKDDVQVITKAGTDLYMPVQTKARNNQTVKDPYKPKANESAEMGQWRERMGQDASKSIYKRRAQTVELVNAVIRNWGLYQFTVRGLSKVQGVISMFAVAYNMMRTISLDLI